MIDDFLATENSSRFGGMNPASRRGVGNRWSERPGRDAGSFLPPNETLEPARELKIHWWDEVGWQPEIRLSGSTFIQD
jgi:hypothetical protein